MTDYILNELSSFRQIFSRERTFQWFCLVILGFILAQDQLGGVTSLVRGLGLETATYHSILNFFGQAIHYQDGLENYIFAWIHNRFSLRIVTINGRPIYVIDSKKIPKQGTKMPGNKTQYQESSSNSKPTFFTGHLFDVIGVLVTTSLGKMLLPFKVRMIDGYKLHNRDTSTLKTRSADIVSMLELKGGILVADAWYACHMFFKAIKEAGGILVSRVGISATGNMPAEAVEHKRPGRPSKYGPIIKLYSLFLTEVMTSIVLKGIDGSDRNIKFWVKDLVWSPVKTLVRFVGSEMSNGRKIVLVCSDLNLSAENIIQAYVYRTSIETTFWYSTQILFNWCYRFWTKTESIVSSCMKSKNLHMLTPEERLKFWEKIKTYECFILIGFFVQSLLVFLIDFKSDLLLSSGPRKWFRCSNKTSLSLLTARDLISSAYFEFYKSNDTITEQTKFIRHQIQKNKKTHCSTFCSTG